MSVGPHELGGSATTLAMAMHTVQGPNADQAAGGEVALPVYHGPSYRLIVDLADPDHASFVIAGGNGGRHDSEHATDHYEKWLRGEYFTLRFDRDELNATRTWTFSADSASGP